MLSINNLTKRKTPSIDFKTIGKKILGRDYELSLTLIGHSLSRSLNRRFKKKDRPANVLAFPLSPEVGEIFIDLSLAKKDWPKFSQSYRHHLAYLFIHASLHLKGYVHSSRMETEEKRLMASLKLIASDLKKNESTHSHRSRHRHRLRSGRRVRI